MDMYSRNLPPFKTVTQNELREIWRRNTDPDVRRLVLEVERYRRTMEDLYRIYTSVHQSWRNSVGGELVGLHQMKQVMSVERGRLGY